MIIYAYYQCLHGKNMLNPPYPRRLETEFLHFGGNFPTFKRLMQKDKTVGQEISRSDIEMAADFQWYFDLNHIIIHKTLMGSAERVKALQDFVASSFPITHISEDASLLILTLKPVSPSQRSGPKPARIDFDGKEPNVILTGWSYAEKNDSGRSYRWSDRRRSVMIIKMDRPAATVMRCVVAPFLLPGGKPQTLGLEVNGRHVEAKTLTEGWQEYAFAVPEAFLRPGHNRFAFSYGYARSPLECGQAADTRALGVAFDAVEVLYAEKGGGTTP
jgi:hypothetical protein